MKKSVSFDKFLTVLEFPMELGDHPSCSVGGPIQLGWFPQDVHTFELDSYDYTDVPKKRGSELVIPCNQRSAILLRAGYSVNEIVQAAEEAKDIKLERLKSSKGSNDQSVKSPSANGLPRLLGEMSEKVFRRSVRNRGERMGSKSPLTDDYVTKKSVPLRRTTFLIRRR